MTQAPAIPTATSSFAATITSLARRNGDRQIVAAPIPQIPGPAPSALAGIHQLLSGVGVDAYVTGWTAWDGFRDRQSGAGAYVFPQVQGAHVRAIALDALIDHGYTVAELDGGTISIDFHPEDW